MHRATPHGCAGVSVGDGRSARAGSPGAPSGIRSVTLALRAAAQGGAQRSPWPPSRPSENPRPPPPPSSPAASAPCWRHAPISLPALGLGETPPLSIGGLFLPAFTRAITACLPHGPSWALRSGVRPGPSAVLPQALRAAHLSSAPTSPAALTPLSAQARGRGEAQLLCFLRGLAGHLLEALCCHWLKRPDS